MLALMDGAQEPFKSANGGTIHRGIDGLIARQAENGLFGPESAGAPYNQGLATLALVEACSMRSNAVWRAAANRAVVFIVSSQDATGGWKYLGSGSGPVNTSVSIWPLIALLRADSVGLAKVEVPIARGLAWLRSTVNPDGLMGYHRANEAPYGHNTLTAAGAVCLLKGGNQIDRRVLNLMLPVVRELAADARQAQDFYRTFFVSQALSLARDQAPVGALAALGDRLLARQHRTGPGAGSWDPADQWGSVGGPVYATALASLSIARN